MRGVSPRYHSKEGILLLNTHRLEILRSTTSRRLDYPTESLVGPLKSPGCRQGRGGQAGRHPHCIWQCFRPGLSHMRFIKLMNYERLIKKRGVNEVSGVRVHHSTPGLAKT